MTARLVPSTTRLFILAASLTALAGARRSPRT